MDEVVQRVLTEFRDPKFLDEVETFVNCHIEEFAVVHPDGSCPMQWMNIHRKYRKIYEDKLLQVLDDCDAECTKFMEYFAACSAVYGSEVNWKALMVALTASEDFHAFQQLMFEAVRENWEPDEDQKGPVPGYQFHQVDVPIPFGAVPGTVLQVNYLGLSHQVLVPEGAPAMTRVTLQVPEATRSEAPAKLEAFGMSQSRRKKAEVENEMIAGVRNVCRIGVETYPEMARTEWVLQNPGQVCLNSSQVHWTAEVEDAIKNNSTESYFTRLSEQLLDLVRLVRGDITKLQRMSIGALVVIDVHAKDTVEKLAKEKIDDCMSFEWISQLRYYWEMDDRNMENMWVRMVQTPFPYGYEYLGNSFRLVITPLTDMCYMTLMGAQSLNLGGAPAGP
ncbi:unnamed protein product, partial [Effrenium voratum]